MRAVNLPVKYIARRNAAALPTTAIEDLDPILQFIAWRDITCLNILSRRLSAKVGDAPWHLSIVHDLDSHETLRDQQVANVSIRTRMLVKLDDHFFRHSKQLRIAAKKFELATLDIDFQQIACLVARAGLAEHGHDIDDGNLDPLYTNLTAEDFAMHRG